MFLSFSFLMSKKRIPPTFLMGLPKEVMLSTVQVQENQLKTGIHLQGTEGPHRLEIMAPVSYPHSPLRAVWSSGVSHSESILSLQTPFSVHGCAWHLGCNSSPKRGGSPQWVTHSLGSNSSFSGEGNWAVSFDAPFSPQERGERREARPFLHETFLSPLRIFGPRSTWYIVQNANQGTCSTVKVVPFHLTSPPLPTPTKNHPKL